MFFSEFIRRLFRRPNAALPTAAIVETYRAGLLDFDGAAKRAGNTEMSPKSSQSMVQ